MIQHTIRSINHDLNGADTGHNLGVPDDGGLRDIPPDVHGKADVPGNCPVYSFHKMWGQDSEDHNMVDTPDNFYSDSHSFHTKWGSPRNRLLMKG